MENWFLHIRLFFPLLHTFFSPFDVLFSSSLVPIIYFKRFHFGAIHFFFFGCRCERNCERRKKNSLPFHNRYYNCTFYFIPKISSSTFLFFIGRSFFFPHHSFTSFLVIRWLFIFFAFILCECVRKKKLICPLKEKLLWKSAFLISSHWNRTCNEFLKMHFSERNWKLTLDRRGDSGRYNKWNVCKITWKKSSEQEKKMYVYFTFTEFKQKKIKWMTVSLTS